MALDDGQILPARLVHGASRFEDAERMLDALQRRDLPVALGCVVVVAATVVLVQLAVDLAYAAVDPRIRVE